MQEMREKQLMRSVLVAPAEDSIDEKAIVGSSIMASSHRRLKMASKNSSFSKILFG